VPKNSGDKSGLFVAVLDLHLSLLGDLDLSLGGVQEVGTDGSALYQCVEVGGDKKGTWGMDLQTQSWLLAAQEKSEAHNEDADEWQVNHVIAVPLVAEILLELVE
jgi:hypothetical protein